MKQFNLLLSLLFIFTTANFQTLTASISESPISINFEDEVPLLKDEKLTMMLTDSKYKMLFGEIKYWESEELITVKTVEQINWISIFTSEDELVFQLPVHSNDLNFSLSGFEPGTYKVGFIIGDHIDVIQSKLTIK